MNGLRSRDVLTTVADSALDNAGFPWLAEPVYDPGSELPRAG